MSQPRLGVFVRVDGGQFGVKVVIVYRCGSADVEAPQAVLSDFGEPC